MARSGVNIEGMLLERLLEKKKATGASVSTMVRIAVDKWLRSEGSA